MTWTAKDVHTLVDKIRYDLTAAQAKITDLKNALDALELPKDKPQHVCPRCGIDRPTETMLQDHLANVHNEAPHERG